MGGAFTTNDKYEKCIQNSSIKLDGKLKGRPRQRCESNFNRKTDLKKKNSIRGYGLDWFPLEQESEARFSKHDSKTLHWSQVENFVGCWETIRFLRATTLDEVKLVPATAQWA